MPTKTKKETSKKTTTKEKEKKATDNKKVKKTATKKAVKDNKEKKKVVKKTTKTEKPKTAKKVAPKKTEKKVSKTKDADSKAVKKKSVKKKSVRAKKTISKKEIMPAKTNKKNINIESVSDDEEREYFLKWKGPDFVRTPEETNLYRIGLVLGGLSFFWFLIGGELLPALTFFMLIVVVFFELKSEVKETEYEINPDGVVLNGDILYFNDIRSFDMGEKAGVYFVRIQMKKAVFPTKDIYLDQSFDLDYVEKLFAYFLPQEEQDGKLFNINPKKELTEDEFIDKAVDDYLNDRY